MLFSERSKTPESSQPGNEGQDLYPIQEYNLSLSGALPSSPDFGRPHSLTQRAIIRAEVVTRLHDLLDSKGLTGRYFIEHRGYFGSASHLTLFLNSQRALSALRQANLNRELPPVTILAHEHTHPRKSGELRLPTPTTTDVAIAPIHCRISSPLFSETQRRASNARGLPVDQHLALLEAANDARREALFGIQEYLQSSGLEGRFVIPSSQWEGTLESLVIIGTSAVEEALRSYAHLRLG